MINRRHKQNLISHISAILIIFVIASYGISTFSVSAATSITVTLDYSKTTGANNLSLGYMLDWETKAFSSSSPLRQLAKDANFKLVRLFSNRIEPCTRWYESSKTGTFDWTEVDLLLQNIFETGAEPLICIGHFSTPFGPPTVPSGMSINSATNLPYPHSYAAYCAEWVRHFKSVGLRAKYYEILNEPYFYYGWDQSETTLIGNFAQLFNTAARAMRNTNSGILLGNNAFLYKKFLNYFLTYGDDLDFIAFNKYGLGEEGGTDATAFYNAKTQFFTKELSGAYTLDQARTLWNTKRGKTLPTIFTESNFSYAYQDGSDSRIQKMAGTVYTGLVLRESVLRGINYHCYYVFSSSPYAQGGSKGFGMINTDNNKPWYPYYVHKWLGTTLSVGDKLATLTTSSSDLSGFAWTHDQRQYFVLICEVDQQRTVAFSGLSGTIKYTKIDNTISWETPQEQTGQIDSTGSLTLNGYTVAIFEAQPTSWFTLSVDKVGSGSVAKLPDQTTYAYGSSVQLTATPASGYVFSGWSGALSGSSNPATIRVDDNKAVTATFTASPSVQVFSDGFESGSFSGWSGKYGAMSVASTVPPGSQVGTYYSTASIRYSGDASRVLKALGSTYSALYVRMYVRMEDLFTGGKQGIGPRFSNADNSVIGYVLVDCTNNKWGYQVLNTGLKSYFEPSSSMVIQADKWYCVEFYMSIGATGTCTLWVDGVQKLTGTYDNDGQGKIGYVSASSYCFTTMATSRTWYGDGFVCSTTYIGP